MSRLRWLKAKPFPHLLAVVIFCFLTIGMTWPLILRLHTHITPGQQPAMTVPYLNLWTLAWNHHWLKGETSSYWDANQFFPHQKTLAYSEPQLGTSLLTFPLVLFGGNTVLAYNVALLVFFSGAGMAVYALCWWVFGLVKEVSKTERFVASITAGILYAFTPYMFQELGVLQLLATLFPPLCLLGLHRFFSDKSWSAALLFSVGFLGCWYTCAHYGLFLSVFVACFALIFFHRELLDKSNIVQALVTVVILVAGLLPLAKGMHAAKVALSLDRSQETVRNLSSVFKKYFYLPSSSLLYEGILGVGSLGHSHFLGGTLICLAVVGTITLFGSQLLSKHSSDSNNFFVNALNRLSLQRYGIFYTAMALVAFILSLGMALTPIHTKGLGVYSFLVWLSPYNLLYKFVPGFSSIRSPYRFSVFVVLFLSILAGVAILWVYRRFRFQWRWALILFLISVAIFELWPVPLRLIKVPTTLEKLPLVYQHVKKLPSDAVLIEFPLPTSPFEEELEATSRYIYFSAFHWQRLVNGYSGYAPRTHSKLTEILNGAKTQTAFSVLKTFGVQYIVAHWRDMTEKETVLIETLEARRLLKPLFRERNQHTLYRVDNNPNEEFAIETPNLERLAIYESKQLHDSVTLYFYYQVNTDQTVLITPWKNPIECEISWYNNVAAPFQKDRKPILVKNVSYQGSRLLNAESNAIAIDVPAPAPGEYQVVVRHRLLSHVATRSGICKIYPHGFVRFSEDF